MRKGSYLQYLQFEKRYSPHTISAYRNDLTQFEHFLQDKYEGFDVTEVQSIHVRAWMVELLEQGISPRSINRKLSTLKSYFKFLLKKGELGRNPMSQIQAPRQGKRLPVFIAQEHLAHLFEKMVFPNNFSGWRDRTVLEVFYATGIRVSELAGLKNRDLDFEKQIVRIFGKGGKERLVPFTKNLETSLKNYLAQRNATFPEKVSDVLFLTDKGKPVHRTYVYRLVKKYLSLITTVEKKSPHVLRHSFATHLSDEGADLNAIKELLGHSSLAATQVYTHNSIEKLRTIYKQAHPKGGD